MSSFRDEPDKFVVISALLNHRQEAWNISMHELPDLRGVFVYCRGFEDGTAHEESDNFNIWFFDREQKEFRYEGPGRSPSGVSHPCIPLVSSPWGLLACDGTRGFLFVLDAKSLQVKEVLTDSMMSNLRCDTADMLEAKPFPGVKELFGTFSNIAAAWVLAYHGEGGPDLLNMNNPEEMVRHCDVQKFLQDREDMWGHNPAMEALSNPSTAALVLHNQDFRAIVALQPEMAAKALIALGKPDPDFIAAVVKVPVLAAEVVQARPDIKDRRLVLSAAGVTRVDDKTSKESGDHAIHAR